MKPRFLLPITALVLAGCASAGGVRAPSSPATSAAPATPTAAATPAAPTATAQAPNAALPPSILWATSSAEHRGLYLEIYRLARQRLQLLSAGLLAGRWAVILDADETVLDNSAYERRRALLGKGYTSKSWDAWVREESAPALPGAVAFLRRVHELGGRVIIVTNRAEALCPETRANLEKDDLRADLVLCRPPQSGDKNPRFLSVENGTTSAGLPPLHVVMWLGDNIQDFPDLSQAIRRAPESAYSRFGQSFFLLPNPMYGSWQRDPG